MTLQPGIRLGPYEVLSAIGAGGMGEVYRARDTKLARDVAIKVLPDLFAADPERLARFEREAQLLASLNHQNIAAIYGLEEGNSIRALVLELVEGPTLAERIRQAEGHAALPLDEALNIACQGAEALEAAHEHGIVHRDLKPANIKVRPDGTVKVLDFGLAKAREVTGAGAALSNSPTMMSVSMPGTILGMAAYMAPEQAKGKDTDRRADVWAFGCVLYEMLTGRAVFEGETVGEILAEVFKADPNWDLLPADTPASVKRVLRRCLEKDRRRRLQSAGDLRIEIEDARVEPEASERAAAPAAPRSARSAWIAAGVAFVASGLLSIPAILHFREVPPIDVPEMRLDIVTPPTSDPMSFAISPDGSHLVFVARLVTARRASGSEHWIRRRLSRLLAPKGRSTRSGRPTAGPLDSLPTAGSDGLLSAVACRRRSRVWPSLAAERGVRTAASCFHQRA